MAKKKIETRGRKTLGNGEPTVRTAVCLPEGLFNHLVKLGETTGLGYSHYIREACIEKFQPERKKISRRK